MKRCLDLAQKGISEVSPNPMVGCVIVYRGEIIGEGYHKKFGEAHAEVNAINCVIDKYKDKAPAMLKEAEVYVNLEPCAHFGKTPPCADLLISKGVKKVIIANTDPFSQVDGKGIAKLQAAGIQTETGLLALEAEKLNKRFFTRIRHKRPYIILKWAQTADGFFSPETPSQKWITGEAAKRLNFKWRTEEDAILVGKNTVLIDNPSLTARIPAGRNPLRVIIDRNLDIPNHYNIFNSAAKTLILNQKQTSTEGNIKYIEVEDMHFYLPQKISFQLYLMDIQSLIVEGGLQILDQFLKADLWDEIRIFESSVKWGNGTPAPQLNQVNKMDDNKVAIIHQEVGVDKLTIYTKLNTLD